MRVLALLQLVVSNVKDAEASTLSGGNAAKGQAAAFAYFQSIMPLVAAASPEAAKAVADAINPAGALPADALAKVQAAFAPVYAALEISAADMGTLASPSTPLPPSPSPSPEFKASPPPPPPATSPTLPKPSPTPSPVKPSSPPPRLVSIPPWRAQPRPSG